MTTELIKLELPELSSQTDSIAGRMNNHAASSGVIHFRTYTILDALFIALI